MKVSDLIKAIEKEQQKGKDELQDEQGLLRLQEVAERYSGEFELVWSHDLADEIKTQPRASQHVSGLSKFDEVVGGFKEQQLITLAGSTGHGKTALGLFMANQMEKLSPVIIPIEQSNEELITQLVENNYKIPRFLSPRRVADRVDVDWIEQRVIEGIAKYNTKFVVIDHLGYIKHSEKDSRENLAYRTGEAMRSLKNMAKRWNVIILLLVHISQKNEGNPPSIEDIKNSSDISQESDIVMTVWLKNRVSGKVRVYEDKSMISILKNRRTGKRGNVGLVFDRETGLFREEQTWVDSMEKDAKREVEMDDKFAEF